MPNTITKAELKEQGWTLTEESLPQYALDAIEVNVYDCYGATNCVNFQNVRLDPKHFIAWREIQEVV